MGYKAYSDSYLMSLTKAQIIELLRIAEHNFFATEEALNNSAKAGMEMAEKYEKAKRLLKAAVEDLNSVNRVLEGNDILCMKYIACEGCPFNGENCNKWRYANEVLKLIES